MTRTALRLAAFVSAAALSACAAPQEVREMAALATANLGKVQSNLGNFVKSAGAANETFAKRISEIESQAKINAAGFEADVALESVLSGPKAGKEMKERFDALLAATDKEAARMAARLQSPALRAKDILGALTTPEVDPKKFQAVADAAGELAKEGDAFERIETLLKFLGDVGKEISEQQKTAEKAEK